jgi:hypothetical protein
MAGAKRWSVAAGDNGQVNLDDRMLWIDLISTQITDGIAVAVAIQRPRCTPLVGG